MLRTSYSCRAGEKLRHEGHGVSLLTKISQSDDTLAEPIRTSQFTDEYMHITALRQQGVNVVYRPKNV